MDEPIFQVDAFTNKPFHGNPAGVVLLIKEQSDKWMLSVAGEMDLSETAFVIGEKSPYNLRWFTPAVEVELCGHATLATAHILFERDIVEKNELIVQGEKGLEKINLKDVYYIAHEQGKSVVYLAEEEITIQKSLDECEKLFPPDKFIRTGGHYIVNIDKIFIHKFPEIVIADKMTVITVDEDKRYLLDSKMKK